MAKRKKISKAAQARIKRAKANIAKALDAGAQFNPAGVSQYTRDTAANRATMWSGSANAASIRAGASGTASATGRGEVKFR